MQTQTPNITLILVVGTLMMFLLVLSIFLLVILHQKRMLKYHMQLGNLEAQKQREILQGAFSAQEEERKRLAEELHDSVGQVLSTIKLNLHRLEESSQEDTQKYPYELELLKATRLLTEETIQEIRRIIHNVHPPLLTDFGLIVALEDLCAKVNNSSYLKVQFHCNLKELSFPLPLQVSLYRIIQELFSNTMKHAAASQICLRLERLDNQLQLSFEDNGTGFEVEQVMRESGGLGLRNLRSRVELLHGTLQLISRPQEGTRVFIQLDLEASPEKGVAPPPVMLTS